MNRERVTGATATLASGATVATLAASYDAAGNLRSKIDAGGAIVYGYQGGHPNRLAHLAVSGTTPGIIGGSLTYDAAGRIVAGAGYSVAYDRRGLASAVQRNGTTLQLAYAPDEARYRAATENAAGTTTVWYLASGAFRVQQSPDGTVAYRQAIVAGGVVVAQLTTRSDATSSFHYLYRDGLGSTVALTDQAGHPVQAFAYGPYGRRRAAGDWSGMLTPGQGPHLNPPIRRGYTGGD